ncbi:MAG: NUDIX domain-containing protein, partial [Chitinophagales bacterium]
TEIYDNPWIKLTEYEVITPGGINGVYGKMHFKNNAVGIIPLTSNQETILVGQYRFPLDLYFWEIPMGGGPIGDDLLLSAQRELKEETGITAKVWTKILDIHPSNSVTDQAGVVYVAQDLTFGDATPEDTEELETKKIPFQEAFEMVMEGKITDAISVASILKLKIL